MIKILHTADIHLGRQFFSLRDKAGDYRAQLIRTFEKIMDLAVKEEVSLVLIAGDLFDNNRIYGSTIGRVMSAFQKLEKSGVRVCILPGIRDALDQDSVYVSLQLPPNVTLLTEKHDRQTFTDLDLTVYGWIPGANNAGDNPLRGFSPDKKTHFHIGMAHCPFRREGESGDEDVTISAEEIAGSGLGYLALGYQHSFEEVSAGNTVACYCGPPEPLDPDRKGAGNVVMVTLQEGETARITPVKVGSKRIERMTLDITSLDSMEDILKRISDQADSGLVLKVMLTGLRSLDMALDCRKIESDLNGRFFKLMVTDASHPNIADIRSYEFPEKSVAGRFLKIIEEKIDTAYSEEEKTILEDALVLGFSLLKNHEDASAGASSRQEGVL